MNSRASRFISTVAACAAMTVGSFVFGEDAPTGAGPTFTRDILPILQNNCQECHRPSGNNFSGMVAPMALMTFEEVRPWAKGIAKHVKAKTMPPWFAGPEFDGVFELQRGLTEKEIATVLDWVKAGSPEGRAEDAPPAKQFSSGEGWTWGEPDIVVKMPKPYWIADDVSDIQPSFSVDLTEEQLPEDKWINWIEFRPGCAAVHHGGAFVTPLKDGKPVIDPISGGKIIGTAPGDGPDVWPTGYGKLLRKGCRITFALHYHKEAGPGTGLWDQSELAIRFQREPVKYVVRSLGVSSHHWEIPPYQGNWKVGANHVFEKETSLINLMPHMHFRGKAAKYEAVYPDGKREVLLNVPKYDYNWQQTYTFKRPKIVPAGTRLEVSMWFDNSKGNPNVKDPERAIGFGSMTDDEMNIGWVECANVQPIEKISLAELGTKPAANQQFTETSE